VCIAVGERKRPNPLVIGGAAKICAMPATAVIADEIDLIDFQRIQKIPAAWLR